MEKDVLSILEEHFQNYVSGEEMARRLFMTRANVWKEIKKLRKQGYEILSSTQKGYCLQKRADYLSGSLISGFLDPGTLDGLEVLPTVDSTNSLAKKLAAKDSDISDFLILSEEQTQGRGRRERSFFSPAGTGIYMSFILRPAALRIQDVQLLTICAALAVCEAVESLLSVKADIKWLNDVYAGGKKLCGILTEGDIELELLRYRYVIVGIGINTKSKGVSLPPDLSKIYTALDKHTRLPIDRNRLAAEVTNAFYRYYRNLTDREEIIERYKARSNVLGKIVTLNQESAPLYRAVDISPEGHLIVEDEERKRIELNAGEVSMKG